MQADANQTESSVAVRTDLAAIFVSLELSRSKWLITSLSPGAGEKMSKFVVPGGDVSALLERFEHLQRKASARSGRSFRIISIQEAGLDGFWIHRVLEDSGIESYVVDPASIAISRRRRRAKTDRIDGETLVRAWIAHKRGEPRFARCFTCRHRTRRTAAVWCVNARRGRLCGARPGTLAERTDQPGPRRLEVGQSEATRDAHPGRMAVGAASTDLCTCRVVQGTSIAKRRSSKEIDNRRAGPQTPRSPLEVRQRRGGHRGRCRKEPEVSAAQNAICLDKIVAGTWSTSRRNSWLERRC